MSDPIEQYQAIQRAQRHLQFAFFAPPAVAFIAVLAFPSLERHLFPWLLLIWFPLAFGLGFRVLALNSCPWCKLGFLSKNPMLQANGIRLLSAKNCATCGMPGKMAIPGLIAEPLKARLRPRA